MSCSGAEVTASTAATPPPVTRTVRTCVVTNADIGPARGRRSDEFGLEARRRPGPVYHVHGPGRLAARGRYQIRWLFFDGVSWTIARDWNSVTTFVWRPTTARRVSHRYLGTRRDDNGGRQHREFVGTRTGSEKPASVTESLGLVPEASTQSTTASAREGSTA